MNSEPEIFEPHGGIHCSTEELLDWLETIEGKSQDPTHD